MRGSCRGVERLSLRARRSAFTKERLSLLVRAFEADGALPTLRRLEITGLPYTGGLTRGVLCGLARSLAAGTIPQLLELILKTDLDDSELISLAEMMEARTRNPDCDRLVIFEGGCKEWFDKASLGTRIRLLRAMPPSVWKLLAFRWHSAYEPCFYEVHAPHLEYLSVFFDDPEAGGIVFSGEVFDGAHASAVSHYFCTHSDTSRHGSSALRRGALQQLNSLKLNGSNLGEATSWTPWSILSA